MAAVGFLDAVRPVLPEVVAFLRPWEADILSKTCSSARRRVAESRTYWLRSLTALCHGPPALEADRHLGDTAATATLSTAALRKRVLREEDGLWATQRLVWWATWHYQVQAAIIGVALFAFYWYIHLHVSSPTSVTAARYVVPVCMSSHPWRRCRPPLCDKEAVNTAYFYAHGDTIIEESPLQMHRHYYHHFPNVRVPGYTSTNTSQCPWVPSRLPRCDGVEQCPTDPLAIARAVGRQLNDERSDRRYTYTYHAWTSALSYLFVGAAFLVSLGLLLLLREDSPPVVHRVSCSPPPPWSHCPSRHAHIYASAWSCTLSSLSTRARPSVECTRATVCS